MDADAVPVLSLGAVLRDSDDESRRGHDAAGDPHRQVTEHRVGAAFPLHASEFSS